MKERVFDIKTKILKGVDLAGQKLINERAREDGEIVISKNGKIEFVKAKDLINNLDIS
ncbi:MAG: hypothetical protein QM212_07280 [Bacteroidota bacterium]|jgi:hypothetical protein|nr:hypothetical protein [Bacteroidales bacterium]MDI9535770.1 hypothetical protein [Bacteroidota bacterium]OQC45200.1 MAG: hypothetical protein BWX59_01412 [Bacteroidetes bacterium ADurb.Bin028]HNY44030.1 hypothetical protein [Bacteroidales bacterium]HOD88393.1 hypothetical protein [Bacteroidales bacterium]